MGEASHPLEEEILKLFERACSERRLDVAEHLLCALETAERIASVGAEPASLPAIIRRAYSACGTGLSDRPLASRTEHKARRRKGSIA